MKLKKKEENTNNEMFKAYFTDYQSPSSMYKKLIETENTEVNKTLADLIKKVLDKLKKSLIIHLKMIQLQLRRMKRY